MDANDQHGDHAEQTVQRLVELHDAHQRDATPMQRLANRVTAMLGRPAAVALILLFIVGWMTGNDAAARLGIGAWEKFPFPDLAFFATIVALLVALLILTTQRHEQVLADRRAQLTLQIAMLSERKLAKLIAMIEEQRRDNPMLASRIDPEAEEMAKPADPIASLEQIEARREEP